MWVLLAFGLFVWGCLFLLGWFVFFLFGWLVALWFCVCFFFFSSLQVEVCGQKVPFKKTHCFNEYDQITKLQTGVPIGVTMSSLTILARLDVISLECLVLWSESRVSKRNDIKCCISRVSFPCIGCLVMPLYCLDW